MDADAPFHSGRQGEEVGFATDSPVEETGFEPSVPPARVSSVVRAMPLLRPPAKRPTNCAPSRAANRYPPEPYGPLAPWNGSPRRTNRAEPQGSCAQVYARCPPAASREAKCLRLFRGLAPIGTATGRLRDVSASGCAARSLIQRPTRGLRYLLANARASWLTAS